MNSEHQPEATSRAWRLGAWLLLLPIVVGCWVVLHYRTPVAYPVDALPTYLAAKVFGDGDLDAVYHPNVWPGPNEFHPAWLAEAKALGITAPQTSFIYGPIYLLLVWPLASVLSLQAFLWLLTWLNAACAVYLGKTSAQLAGVRPLWAQLGIALLVSVSFPCSYAALLGQNVLIAAALVLAAYVRLGRGDRGDRWWALGYLLLACVVKPWCILFLGVLLLLRRLRELAIAATGYLLLLQAAPRLLLPGELMSGYEAVVGKVMGISLVAHNNVSLRALVDRLSWREWPEYIGVWNAARQASSSVLWVDACGVLLVGAAFSWLGWTRRVSTELLGACAMCVGLFALSLCWSHYLVFCLPLVVIVAFGQYPPWLRALAAVSGLWLLRLMLFFPPHPIDVRPRWVWAWVLSAPLLLTTALALLTLWQSPSRKTPRSEHSGAA